MSIGKLIKLLMVSLGWGARSKLILLLSLPPSPEVYSLALFDINDLYSLRRSADVVTAMDS